MAYTYLWLWLAARRAHDREADVVVLHGKRTFRAPADWAGQQGLNNICTKRVTTSWEHTRLLASVRTESLRCYGAR